MKNWARMGVASALCALAWTSQAQARSGQAAYHLHTGEMVTAARYEPRGSVLRVTNPLNGNSVVVRVNDRGPFNGNRILDLSTGAFSKLYGGLRRGVGPVQYEVISRGSELSSRGGRRTGWSKKSKSYRRYSKNSRRGKGYYRSSKRRSR